MAITRKVVFICPFVSDIVKGRSFFIIFPVSPETGHKIEKSISSLAYTLLTKYINVLSRSFQALVIIDIILIKVTHDLTPNNIKDIY
jgi:hypothetical protein